ncbi:ABC transporter substrate-binding protein [Psychrobacter sp. ENNN9_III]|uniref:ABC transporter substrate-binding protein n=1 Tax=Psychrobacter sp. ENNN9_III TaxID=1254334 RepID=UPI00071E8162|nr:Fe(3+) dicitrate ABC transporter substrate-binding protein [Psychrobacter sp. ENNN9_III]
MNQRPNLTLILPLLVIVLIVVGGIVFINTQKNNVTATPSLSADNDTSVAATQSNGSSSSDNHAVQLLTDKEIKARLPNLSDYPQNPKRIVVLEYSFLGDALALGLTPVGIADDNKPDSIIPEFTQQLSDYTSVGSRYQPSLEAIADLQPDLIIADDERHTVIADELNHITPSVVLKSRGESYAENIQTAQLVGHIVHQDKKMARIIDSHLKKMADLQSQLAATPLANHSVQFAIISDKGMWLHGPSSYAGSLLDYLNIKSPIPEQTDEAYIATSLEQLIAANPDWLLIGRYNERTIYDEWKSSPLFNQLTAVKNDQVIEVDPNYWALNRSMQSAEYMAAKLLEIAQKSKTKGSSASLNESNE